MGDPKRIAIIPARGGSKRLPDKNIRPFGGRPMLAHVLETARASGLYDVVHVSTEDGRVAKVAASAGFPPDFPRPPELADDHTPLMPVLRHVVEEYGRRGRIFDQVHLLMACAPLVDANDLRAATKLFEERGATQSVIAIAPFPAPVEWAFRRETDGSLKPVQPGMFAVRSQDLPVGYYDAGCFIVFGTDRVVASSGAGDDTQYLGYELPRWKAVDIDTEEDWVLAESILLGRRARGPRASS